MGKIPTNSLGKSSELKLHCFCLYNAYSMPKNIYSVCTYHELTLWKKFCIPMTFPVCIPNLPCLVNVVYERPFRTDR